MAGRFPMPRQQFGQPVLLDVGDADEHIGQPGEGIDIVEFGGRDQRGHGCGAVSPTLGTGE